MKRILLTTLVLPLLSSVARVEFAHPFSPTDDWVKPQERPFRDALCLNGAWQFQPVAVPAGFKRDAGTPPDLPPPAKSARSATPIRIPSPWNVNAWGCGRDVGAGTPNPYWPDSVYFPSYPAAWDRIVFKVAATKLDGEQPATLAVRMEASDPAFMRALETTVECGK